MPGKTSDLSALILGWYDQHGRKLPWRAAPGQAPDPYHVWLSEIMLQQTTVATVKNRFRRFLQKWPTVGDLAAASLDEVLTEWAGLGYYARARNLHKSAIVVSTTLDGVFPEQNDQLQQLPGIGSDTSAAILAIAVGQPAVVVDGNVERVIARMHAIKTPLPKAKAEIRRWAALHSPDRRAGDYAQAVMDLGATVCMPRNPDCTACPWQGNCQAYSSGATADYPRKAPRKNRPTRHAHVYWLERAGKNGPEVLMRKRAEKGLLGGMMEFPSSPWQEGVLPDFSISVPEGGSWRLLPGQVIHVFTHFKLEFSVWCGVSAVEDMPETTWVPVAELDGYALPTLMKKVANKVVGVLL